jgi:hypothetical protein
LYGGTVTSHILAKHNTAADLIKFAEVIAICDRFKKYGE